MAEADSDTRLRTWRHRADSDMRLPDSRAWGTDSDTGPELLRPAQRRSGAEIRWVTRPVTCGHSVIAAQSRWSHGRGRGRATCPRRAGPPRPHGPARDGSPWRGPSESTPHVPSESSPTSHPSQHPTSHPSHQPHPITHTRSELSPTPHQSHHPHPVRVTATAPPRHRAQLPGDGYVNPEPAPNYPRPLTRMAGAHLSQTTDSDGQGPFIPDH